MQDRTPLHNAAEKGHHEVVEFLLESKANIEAQTFDQRQAIHYAAINDHLEVVKILIAKGANIEAIAEKSQHPASRNPSRPGKTALHYATKQGNAPIVSFLLSKNANVNAQDTFGYSPLHMAAEVKNFPILSVLVDNGANHELETTLGAMPIHLAAKLGYADVVSYFLDIKISVDIVDKNYGRTPLIIAAGEGHLSVVSLLLDRKANIEATTADRSAIASTAIQNAALSGKTNVLLFLLQQKANINAASQHSNTLLHLAIINRHLPLMKELINQNIVPINAVNEEGYTPLMESISKEDTTIVQYLIENKANINATDKFGRTCLHQATHIPKLFDFLISHGADVNAVDLNGCSVGHVTAKSGFLTLLQTLLAKGANVDVTDKKGYKIIHHALLADRQDIVTFLLTEYNENFSKDLGSLLHLAVAQDKYSYAVSFIEKKADINSLNSNGATPIHIAATLPKTNILSFLLQKGTHDVKDNNGSTPLHYAAFSGSQIAVDFLLTKQANVNALSNLGRTPLHLAVREKKEKIVSILLQKGVDKQIADKEGKTALAYAKEIQNSNIIALLDPPALEQTIETTIHEHILPLLPQVYKGTYNCDKCKQPGSGSVYHCEACSFDLHPNCAIATKKQIYPQTINTTKHEHPLQLHPTIYEGSYGCDECGESGSGSVYHCDACSFDMHPKCALVCKKQDS